METHPRDYAQVANVSASFFLSYTIEETSALSSSCSFPYTWLGTNITCLPIASACINKISASGVGDCTRIPLEEMVIESKMVISSHWSSLNLFRKPGDSMLPSGLTQSYFLYRNLLEL